MPSNSRVPAYRLHKPSGRAIVKHKGTVHYIGKFGSKASKLEYARLLAQWSAGEPDNPAAARDDLTVVELVAAARRQDVLVRSLFHDWFLPGPLL